MAALLFKERKGMNFSCTAPASTAVCLSIDKRSIVQPITGRSLDRHNPHLRDPIRSRATASTTKSLPHLPTPPPPPSSKHKTIYYKQKNIIARKSLDIITVSSDLISPPVSSRYLLNNDESFFDVYPDPDPDPDPDRIEPDPLPPPLLLDKSAHDESSAEIFEECDVSVDARSSFVITEPKEQVVVLRVSLHCKGCQAKVKKHLSRMEGVTSFNIDFATKKVTVIGDVTPLGVLNSISKVKNAQFWPSPPGSASEKLPYN